MTSSCKTHKAKGTYSKDWDAHYCKPGNHWISRKCADGGIRCELCIARPKKPLGDKQ